MVAIAKPPRQEDSGRGILAFPQLNLRAGSASGCRLYSPEPGDASPCGRSSPQSRCRVPDRRFSLQESLSGFYTTLPVRLALEKRERILSLRPDS